MQAYSHVWVVSATVTAFEGVGPVGAARLWTSASERVVLVWLGSMVDEGEGKGAVQHTQGKQLRRKRKSSE